MHRKPALFKQTLPGGAAGAAQGPRSPAKPICTCSSPAVVWGAGAYSAVERQALAAAGACSGWAVCLFAGTVIGTCAARCYISMMPLPCHHYGLMYCAAPRSFQPSLTPPLTAACLPAPPAPSPAGSLTLRCSVTRSWFLTRSWTSRPSPTSRVRGPGWVGGRSQGSRRGGQAGGQGGRIQQCRWRGRDEQALPTRGSWLSTSPLTTPFALLLLHTAHHCCCRCSHPAGTATPAPCSPPLLPASCPRSSPRPPACS